MDKASNWILIAAVAVLGIAGLFVSSHAGHGVGYFGGLAMFGFGVFFVGMLIRILGGHE